jgi:hypothetical protein
MKAFWFSPAGQLSVGLVLVAAVFAAFAVGGEAGYGLRPRGRRARAAQLKLPLRRASAAVQQRPLPSVA